MTGMFSGRFTGLRDVRGRFDALRPGTEAYTQFLSLAGRLVARYRAEAPYGPPTEGGGRHRHLRAVIKAEVKTNPPRISIDAPGVPYLPFVLHGTKAHTIRPKNGKYLRFKIGSRVVFTKEVHHPGTKANPFHHRAMAASWDDIHDVAKRIGFNMAKFLVRG